MPRVCTVCRHPEREAIDADLVGGQRTLRHIASSSAISTRSLQRHRSHITAEIVHAAETCEQDRGASLLQKIQTIEAEAKRLGKKAESEGDLRAALLALRELARAFELQGRVLGAFQADTAPAVITVKILQLGDLV